jgi:cell division protein FtsB
VFKNRKIFFFVFLVLVLIAVGYLTFNEYGFIRYFRLKSKISNLEGQLQSIELERKALEAEIDSLDKKIPAKIEHVAREKYGMARKNEVRIQVQK